MHWFTFLMDKCSVRCTTTVLSGVQYMLHRMHNTCCIWCTVLYTLSFLNFHEHRVYKTCYIYCTIPVSSVQYLIIWFIIHVASLIQHLKYLLLQVYFTICISVEYLLHLAWENLLHRLGYLVHLLYNTCCNDRASGASDSQHLLQWSGYLVHLVHDEIGHLEVAVDHGIHLEVVVVFAEGIDQSFCHLHHQPLGRFMLM